MFWTNFGILQKKEILRTQLRDPHFTQNYDHFQYYISWHQNKVSLNVLLKMVIVLSKMKIA